MNAIAMLNRFSVHWANFMWVNLLGTTFALLAVTIVWGLFHKKLSPQFGYCLFFLVLIKCLIPFSMTLPSAAGQLAPMQSREFAVFWEQLSQPFSIPDGSSSSTAATPRVPAESNDAPATGSSSEPPRAVSRSPLPSAGILPSITAFLMLGWFAMVCFLLLRLALGQKRVYKIVRDGPRIELSSIPVDIRQLANRLGIQRPIRIIQSKNIEIPFVHGLFRPSLLIPHDFFKSFTPNQNEWILLHELSHVRRWDTLSSFVQKLVQCTFFFNPAVWIANWTIDQQREFACDDLALLACGSSRLECGEGFLSLAKRINHRPAFSTGILGLFNYNSQLRSRMMRILDGDRTLNARLSMQTTALLVFVACLVLPTVKAADTQSNPDSLPALNADSESGSPHLSFADKKDESLTIRRLPDRYFPPNHTLPSSNGRFVLGYNPRNGNMILKNLETGESKELTTNDSGGYSYDTGEISPDSKKIAFVWAQQQAPRNREIRVMNIDGSENKLVSKSEEIQRPHITQWTEDGQNVGLWIRNGNTIKIGLLSIIDGSLKILMTREEKEIAGPPNIPCLSPNGDYIYFSKPISNANKPFCCDIYKYDVEKKEETAIVEHPADDRILACSPDGKWLLFSSDRIGTSDIWLLDISDGNSFDPPTLVARGIEIYWPDGITANGAFYYWQECYLSEIYLIEIDGYANQTNQVEHYISTEIKTPQKKGGEWSQDGNFVAYASWDKKNMPLTFHVYSMKDQTARSYRSSKIQKIVSMRWSPDNRYIYFWGSTINSGFTIGRIDPLSGEEQVVMPADNRRLIGSSPDGGIVYYDNLRPVNDDEKGIFSYDIQSGNTKKIYAADPYSIRTSWISPDGKRIVMFCNMPERAKEMKVVSIDTGDAEPFLDGETELISRIIDVQWDASGESLLVLEYDEGNAVLWEMHVNNRNREKRWEFSSEIFGDRANNYRIHPDGTHVCINSNQYFPLEHWAMENFLPKPPSR